MKTYNINQQLTKELIQYYNQIANRENIILVFPNTKGLNTELLKITHPNIIFSITGGLTPSKEKYNNPYYQSRTYYTPQELSTIIYQFELIERKINPLWNDLEKVMFIYQKLCKYLIYAENKYNNRDASRNLLGMITGKSVCSGCALIFKEAMDRLGIECYYQNVQNSHSWNVIKVNGKYYPIELTWDVYEKTDNCCHFYHFCRQDKKSFYGNKYHSYIQYEQEEAQYPLEAIPKFKLEKMLEKITIDEKTQIIHKKRENRQNIKLLNKYTIKFKDDIPYYDPYPQATFIRNDGSSFLVIPTGNQTKKVNEYIFLEYDKQTDMIQVTRIYSEMSLLQTDNIIRNNIANELLSKSRIKTKVNEYNGYVGYLLSYSKIRYYDKQFEEKVINKFRIS